jgi:hypothetical protein
MRYSITLSLSDGLVNKTLHLLRHQLIRLLKESRSRKQPSCMNGNFFHLMSLNKLNIVGCPCRYVYQALNNGHGMQSDKYVKDHYLCHPLTLDFIDPVINKK